MSNQKKAIVFRIIILIFILCPAAYGGAIPPFTTIFMRGLLDDADAPTARETLGIKTSFGQDGHYVGRGNPASYDWTEADLTTDGDWHDLDCSAIVPSSAVAIKFECIIQDDVAGEVFNIRKKGNTNNINMGSAYTQVANIPRDKTFIVTCDYSQKVQYMATNAEWDSIDLVVSGWWTSRHRILDESGDYIVDENGEYLLSE